MDFFAILIIAIVVWCSIGYAAYIVVRTGRRLYNSGKWKRWIFRVALIGTVLSIILITSSSHPIVQRLGAYIAIALIAVPFAILFFLQLSFWLYHWMKHGDPFYEPGIPDRASVTKDWSVPEKKRKLEYCPICKKNSHCKVKKTPAGFWIHVMRG